MFNSLCTEAGVEVETINGYAKGVGYSHLQKFDKINHSWNIVKINGQPYLLDCTWSAGSLNAELKYVKYLNPSWFLTMPEIMINSHLPLEDKYQLLLSPMTKEQFELNEFEPTMNFYYYVWKSNVEVITHETPIINTNEDKLTIKLGGDLSPFTLHLKKDGEIIKGGAKFEFDPQNKVYTVDCLFNEGGKYMLEIFCNPYLPYYINVNSEKKLKNRAFPIVYDSNRVKLFEPNNYFLKSKSRVNFKAFIKDTVDAAVYMNGHFNY